MPDGSQQGQVTSVVDHRHHCLLDQRSIDLDLAVLLPPVGLLMEWIMSF